MWLNNCSYIRSYKYNLSTHFCIFLGPQKRIQFIRNQPVIYVHPSGEAKRTNSAIRFVNNGGPSQIGVTGIHLKEETKSIRGKNLEPSEAAFDGIGQNLGVLRVCPAFELHQALPIIFPLSVFGEIVFREDHAS